MVFFLINLSIIVTTKINIYNYNNKEMMASLINQTNYINLFNYKNPELIECGPYDLRFAFVNH